jgi:hypothetical protein
MAGLRIDRRAVLAGASAALLGATAARADDAPAALPFELFRQKIFVPLRLNGVDGTGFLDTGARDLVVDPAFAAKAGVVGVRDIVSAGWGTESPAREADGVVMELAGVQAMGHAQIRDTSVIQRSVARPFDVIVGSNLFDQFVVEIDFDQSQLRVSPHETFMPPPEALRLDLKRSGGEAAAPIQLEAQGPITAGIDLGSSMALAVSRRLAEHVRLLDGRASSSVVINSLGGSGAHTVTTAGGFSLGPFPLPDVPAVVFDSLTHDAVLGLPVFLRFKLWLDLGQQRMWLAPGGKIAQPFDRDRVGLYTTVEDGGAFRVILAAPGSPAEKAGFATGDRMQGVNGRTLADLRVIDPPPPRAGVTLSYTLVDGTVRSLVTADYY